MSMSFCRPIFRNFWVLCEESHLFFVKFQLPRKNDWDVPPRSFVKSLDLPGVELCSVFGSLLLTVSGEDDFFLSMLLFSAKGSE